MIENALEKILN